jgi:hypothetical protein
MLNSSRLSSAAAKTKIDAPHPSLYQAKLAPPVYEHIGDYEVLDDGQPIGRIYEIHAPLRPDELWSWSIMVLGAHRAGIETVGRTATFQDAKEQINQSEL